MGLKNVEKFLKKSKNDKKMTQKRPKNSENVPRMTHSMSQSANEADSFLNKLLFPDV